MAASSGIGKVAITRQHRTLLLTAAVMTYLLVTLGGIVCVTDSSRGCPDWPGCYGRIVPPMRTSAIIEFLHRFLAALTSVLIVASAIVGWWKSRWIRWVSWPPLIAVALLLAVIVFGALVVLRGLSPGIAAVDLGSALMVLALMLTASVVAFSRQENPVLPDRLSFRTPFARLTLWTFVVVFVVLVSGVLVADTGSHVRCLGWPLYEWLMPVDFRGWLQLTRRLVGVLASILVIAVVLQAWRTQHGQTAILRTATVMAVLLVAETVVGVLMVTGGLSLLLQVVYVTLASTLWALLVVLVVLAGLASPTLTADRL